MYGSDTISVALGEKNVQDSRYDEHAMGRVAGRELRAKHATEETNERERKKITGAVAAVPCAAPLPPAKSFAFFADPGVSIC
jgi:hypothetical protein